MASGRSQDACSREARSQQPMSLNKDILFTETEKYLRWGGGPLAAGVSPGP